MPTYANRKLKTSDGETLYLTAHIIDHPVATLLLVHGIGEHSGRYEELYNFLGRHGIACRSFDLRGHGRSGGKRGHVASYDLFMQDIHLNLRQVQEEFPSLPLFLYGHSMGGNLVLNFILRYPGTALAGCIATSPWLGLTFRTPALKVWLARLMSVVYPGYRESNDLDPKHLSHDPKVAEAYRKDHLIHNKISARLYTELDDAAEYALEHAGQLTIPLLLIHGREDPITLPDATQRFASQAGELAEIQLFEGMYHETHHETDRQEMMDAVWNWIKKHL